MENNNNQDFEQKKPEPEQKETVKEVHHHHYKDKKGFGFGKLFLGVLIVLIGLAYLAQTMGWANINISFSIWKLWPLLIIFIGLSLLSSRGWLSAVVGTLVTVIVLGIIAFIIFGNIDFEGTTGSLRIEAVAIDKEEGAISAVLDIDTGAGKLRISGGGDMLVVGSFESNFLQLVTRSEVDNNIQNVAFRTEGSWAGFKKHVNNLNLQFSTNTPLTLNIDSGAMDMDVDLSDVMAESIDINTGASSLDLILGDKIEASELDIDAGASSINITLPRTIGAKVKLDSGLSSKTLVDFRQLDSNNYESINYKATKKKINIDLDLGAASLNINWK